MNLLKLIGAVLAPEPPESEQMSYRKKKQPPPSSLKTQPKPKAQTQQQTKKKKQKKVYQPKMVYADEVYPIALLYFKEEVCAPAFYTPPEPAKANN